MNDRKPNWNWRVRKEDRGFALVVFIPLLALALWAGFEALRAPPMQVTWVFVVLCLWPLLLPPGLYIAKCRTLFTAAVAVLIPLEVVCVFAARYTIIGVDVVFPMLLLWANLLPIGMCLLRRDAVSVAPWVVLVLIALAIGVPQVRWGVTLAKLQSEAAHIIAYSYDYRIRHGTFPADLSNYSWRYPALRDHFGYVGHGTDDKFTYPFKDDPHYDRSDKFSMRYYVGNKGTAYWFSSKKGWFVEDD
jgi:hypothetical protein